MTSSKEQKECDSDSSKPGARYLYAMNIWLLYREKKSIDESYLRVELEEE